MLGKAVSSARVVVFLKKEANNSRLRQIDIQSNLNSSNTDCSFTMAYSNSFLSPYQILLIAQKNSIIGKFLILS